MILNRNFRRLVIRWIKTTSRLFRIRLWSCRARRFRQELSGFVNALGLAHDHLLMLRNSHVEVGSGLWDLAVCLKPIQPFPSFLGLEVFLGQVEVLTTLDRMWKSISFRFDY